MKVLGEGGGVKGAVQIWCPSHSLPPCILMCETGALQSKETLFVLTERTFAPLCARRALLDPNPKASVEKNKISRHARTPEWHTCRTEDGVLHLHVVYGSFRAEVQSKEGGEGKDG